MTESITPPTGQQAARVRLAFRFVGDSVDPDAITRLLGLDAALSRVKGGRDARPGEHPFHTGIWLIRSGLDEEAPLHDHMNALLTVLESRAALVTQLATPDCRPEFRCGVF